MSNHAFDAARRTWLALAVPLLGVCAAGCATTGVRVTGDPTQGNTQSFEQAETAVAGSYCSGKSRVIASFNDGTDSTSTIVYTSTTRKTLQGASLMGWSYSTNNGTSWTYGGKVQPPKGWSVIWGDPAMTTARDNYCYVFISNLAVPDSKYPSGGISGALNAYIGGACIATSKDGGVTFKDPKCVHDNHHFYDGGSMTADGDGAIYAAYVDVDSEEIDVWRSPTKDGTFAMLPSPFPGTSIASHPRLRYDSNSQAVYVAAQRYDGVVFVNRYKNGAWGTAAAASYGAAVYPTITLSDRTLRTGPQFSFDVGAESVNDNDAVRFIYTMWDDKESRYYVTGSFCKRDLSGCYAAPEWGTTPGNLSLTSDQFNPNVRAFPGLFSIAPLWKTTYLSRQRDPKGNTVSIEQGNLAVFSSGTRILVPFKLIDSHLVCPDLRGYWGDYDDMELIAFTDSGNAVFLRAFSDSSQGCTTRWEYTAAHLHVSSATVQ
jgi:hypothetical protein